MSKPIPAIIVFIVGILISLLLWFVPMGWPQMFRWLSPETARLAVWVVFVITLGMSIILLLPYISRRLYPIKLKADDLVCWRIERPEPEHHGWHHCYEYNFEGEISIMPRATVVISAFYISFQAEKTTIRADYVQPPAFPEVTLDEKIVNRFFFQVRLAHEIEVPSHGYLVLEFAKGGRLAKHQVVIRRDDVHRPNLNALRMEAD